jgi:TMEM175 potassium channel family protein
MGSRWGTGRVEAFSDGVFAIAITLLVLDIGVPPKDFDNLWAGIANAWPSYLGYVTSFATIGALWLLHHGVFRRLEYADDRIMRLNLLLLMVVSFLPFPTRLMAQAIRESDAERAAVIVYGATLFAITLLFAAMWEAAVRDRGLLKAGVTDGEIAALRRVTTPGLGFYLGITLLAIVAPRAAAVRYLVVAIGGVLRAPADLTVSREGVPR